MTYALTKKNQNNLDSRYMSHRGRTCLLSVDRVDVCICEPFHSTSGSVRTGLAFLVRDKQLLVSKLAGSCGLAILVLVDNAQIFRSRAAVGYIFWMITSISWLTKVFVTRMAQQLLPLQIMRSLNGSVRQICPGTRLQAKFLNFGAFCLNVVGNPP